MHYKTKGGALEEEIIIGHGEPDEVSEVEKEEEDFVSGNEEIEDEMDEEEETDEDDDEGKDKSKDIDVGLD